MQHLWSVNRTLKNHNLIHINNDINRRHKFKLAVIGIIFGHSKVSRSRNWWHFSVEFKVNYLFFQLRVSSFLSVAAYKSMWLPAATSERYQGKCDVAGKNIKGTVLCSIRINYRFPVDFPPFPWQEECFLLFFFFWNIIREVARCWLQQPPYRTAK